MLPKADHLPVSRKNTGSVTCLPYGLYTGHPLHIIKSGRIKQRHLPVSGAVCHKRQSLPPAHLVLVGEVSHNILFLQLRGVHHPSVTGDKIECALQHHTYFLQILKGQTAKTPGRHDPSGAFNAHTRNPQQQMVIRPVNLHREALQMPDSPVRFRVNGRIEIRPVLRQQLIHLKIIEPKKPVCLIQPVFPKQRRAACRRGQIPVLVHVHKSRVVHPLQRKLVIEIFRHRHDLVITLRQGAYDHLGGLSRLTEMGCVLI